MKKMNLTLMLLFLAVISFAQVPSYVPSNGLVGWWPFNGNANDESGNGNNGTVNGGVSLTQDRFGNNNSSYSFDGNVNTKIRVPLTNQLTGTKTYSFWFKIPVNFINPYLHFITCNNSGNDYLSANGNYQVYINNNTRGKFYDGKTGLMSTLFVNDDQWHHATIVHNYTNQNSKLYIDGILNGQINSTNFNLNPVITELAFGSQVSGNTISTNSTLFGQLDDIGIWNRALDSTEVAALYNGNICYQTVSVTDTLFINTNITGFNPVTYENTIRIWPNPSSDHLTIDAGDLNVMNGYSIRIINSLGQQVFQSSINQQQFYIDLSTWTGNGMYYVNVIDPNGNIIDIKKIVLN